MIGYAFAALIWLALFGLDVGWIADAAARGESLVVPVALLSLLTLVGVAVVLAGLTKAVRLPRLAQNLLVLGVTALGVGGMTYLAVSDVEVRRPETAVIAALAPACQGSGVAGAALFEPGGIDPNHLVVLGADGGEIRWTGDARASWRPATLAEAELVACVDAADRTAVEETCQYASASPITRYSASRDVSVVAARTGAEVAGFTVRTLATSCPASAPKEQTELSASVDWRAIEEHLAGLVTAGAFSNPDPESDGEVVLPNDGRSGASAEPGSSAGTGEAIPAPTTKPRRVELRDAIANALVGARGTGQGLQALDLELTSKVEIELEVVVKAGTMLDPSASGTQSMVVISTVEVEIRPKAKVEIELDVACSEMHLDQPAGSDRFQVRATTAGAKLRKLLAAPGFADESFRVKQFAIWTVTDNPTRGGFVQLGSFGVGSGPSKVELGRIKALFESAGLTASEYRAFR